MKNLTLVLIFFTLFFTENAVSAQSPKSLQILSREHYDQRTFNLSDNDWRWLGKKRLLKVAVWRPEIPPLDMFTQDGKYEGMTADYLLLISSYLGIRINILEFPSREDALKALDNRDVDMVVDVSGKSLMFQSKLEYSQRFISDHPVLVHAKLTAGERFSYQPGMRLAIARWYVDDDWIKANFPGVRIMHFDTDEQAMASVAFQENDFFIGNLVTTSYLLDRNYTNFLQFQAVYPERDTGSQFIVRREDGTLLRTLNSALSAIPLSQKQAIQQQWSQGADLWRMRGKVELTGREQMWKKQHPEIRVSVNTFYAPFTMVDANGQFYGVAADVLDLISQRTGIRFIPVPERSLDAMQEQLKSGVSLFIGALSHSSERNSQLLFTRPYFRSPFVMIVKDGAGKNIGFQPGVRIALVKGNQLAAQLIAEYPGIRILETDNASVAMQAVAQGQADIAIHTLFGASYMIERYFKGQLKIARSINTADAEIGFAVSRNQPELMAILNKSLENISPAEIGDIIEKWQVRPDVRLDTWELYRKQFWWLFAVAAMVVVIALIWVYYMRREVNARVKAQTRLQDQLKFNEILYDTMPLPIYVTDPSGHVLLVNQSLLSFFNIDQQTFTATPLTEAGHPLHSLWRQSDLPEFHGKPVVVHACLFDGSRQRNVLHYTVSFTDAAGSSGGYICTWMDMTEQEELNSALSEARERAEQANRAKSTFLATMSHEIRTPVSAIIGLLELAVKTPQTASDKEDTIRVAWESARSLMGLIGDILDMARIESGRLELTPEWVRTADLLPPVVRVFEGLARQKSLRLRNALPAVIPYEVFIDPLRFRQVLSNLVSNAIKFTDRGSVEVDLHIIPISGEEKVHLSVTVKDTGKGISEAEQADIFDPWVQARAGRSQSGSGLGLAICAQLVTMMGGEISMKSQPGQGTEVTFFIPADIHMERTEPEITAAADTPGTWQTLNILAVDDHPANRMLLRHQLAYLGHNVTEANDGEEGWQKWQSDDFDVVITDCSMPGMNGLELTRLIRQHQKRQVIILGLTANAWPEERSRCQDAGMDDCLFKPLQLPQLQVILEQAAQQIMPQKARTVSLDQLLNFDDLRKLTHLDEKMLLELLSVTLQSNEQDLFQAQDLYELEDWPEMAKCIHRISGAAQIIGATRAEKSCRLLEHDCLTDEPDTAEITAQWQEVFEAVTELNRSIAEWLGVAQSN